MYLDFFGLEQQPFSLTPNTSLYYGLPPHEEAIQVLRVALENGEGILKITGEVGTGKSMVLRFFMNNIGSNYEVVYIPNPVLTPYELKLSIAKELGIDISSLSSLALNDLVNQKLININKQGKKVVLFIDESQALYDETLETIRLLGNLETESFKLLQIVLFGQPELDEKLNQEKLRQLKQRITFSYKLRPLLLDETYAYLNYRMQAAGYKGQEIFSYKIARIIFKSSKGVPRLINILANKCLMLAYGHGKYVIDKKYVYDAIEDSQLKKYNFKAKIFLISFVTCLIWLSIVVLVYLYFIGYFK
ncbi:MAG: ExeA family protein [Succinivibrionaceae bacterium]